MRPNFPSQIAQRFAAPFRKCWGLLRIVVPCRPCVGSNCARLLFAIALRAHVKHAFGIVVACQVSWRIGTPCAKLDPHVRPPEAKQQTSSQLWFAGGAHA